MNKLAYFCSHLPHLGMAEDDIGRGHGHVAAKDAYLTHSVSLVTGAGDVMLVDVQVDAIAFCDDC